MFFSKRMGGKKKAEIGSLKMCFDERKLKGVNGYRESEALNKRKPFMTDQRTSNYS